MCEQENMIDIPYFTCDNKSVSDAYRLAVGTLCANIQMHKEGLLEEEKPVIMAGVGYVTPWTRDGSINTWNAGGLVCPEISLNTLKAVLIEDENGYRPGGDYWDAIIWTTGAWNLYLYTGDKAFLRLAYDTTVNALAYYEKTEFDAARNLFRGGACYGDGVAAYPDIYARPGKSGIICFKEVKEHCCENGEGIPLMTLSTNCLYYNAYVLADRMAEELGEAKRYEERAQAMYHAINAGFWSEEKGNYTYIIDDFGGCDYEEGMGVAFAILFGIADEEKIAKIMQNQHVTERGIACVWPSFERYLTEDGMSFGRHSGTVWPHIQDFWADAAARAGYTEIFDREVSAEIQNALSSGQFAEIYHPITGTVYGGRQEREGRGIVEWVSQPWQTWSATAFLRNVYFDFLGMRFDEDGLRFAPIASSLAKELRLRNFKYRGCTLDIKVHKTEHETKVLFDGVEGVPFIGKEMTGAHEVEIWIA